MPICIYAGWRKWKRTWLTHEARGHRREGGQRRAGIDSRITSDDRRASFRSPVPLALPASYVKHPGLPARCPAGPGRSSRCRRRSGNTHFLPWPRNLGGYHFPSASPPIVGAQRYPPSSSSSSPTTTTTTSTMNRRHHRRRCRCHSHNKQLMAASSRRLMYHCQTVFASLACHVSSPYVSLALSLPQSFFRPSIPLSRPSSGASYRLTPVLAINRSSPCSPCRVSRSVAIVGQDRPALARLLTSRCRLRAVARKNGDIRRTM